jgi:hypothetical protein
MGRFEYSRLEASGNVTLELLGLHLCNPSGVGAILGLAPWEHRRLAGAPSCSVLESRCARGVEELSVGIDFAERYVSGHLPIQCFRASSLAHRSAARISSRVGCRVT